MLLSKGEVVQLVSLIRPIPFVDTSCPTDRPVEMQARGTKTEYYVRPSSGCRLRYVIKAIPLKVAQVHNMKKNTVKKNTV